MSLGKGMEFDVSGSREVGISHGRESVRCRGTMGVDHWGAGVASMHNDARASPTPRPVSVLSARCATQGDINGD